MVDLAHAFAAPISSRHLRLSPSVRRAQPADHGALLRLINAAYAVERFFVDGERTDAAELAGLAERGHFLVLDAGNGLDLAAAIYVRIDDDGRGGAIGLLSVAPEWQGLGLGRRLVAVAEALCTALGCATVGLQIVNLRQELGPWYRSQGYREIGTAPYDHRAPKLPCHFVCMEKRIS
jgi:GNAT superfamily N-acetyltransferase